MATGETTVLLKQDSPSSSSTSQDTDSQQAPSHCQENKWAYITIGGSSISSFIIFSLTAAYMTQQGIVPPINWLVELGGQTLGQAGNALIGGIGGAATTAGTATAVYRMSFWSCSSKSQNTDLETADKTSTANQRQPSNQR